MTPTFDIYCSTGIVLKLLKWLSYCNELSQFHLLKIIPLCNPRQHLDVDVTDSWQWFVLRPFSTAKLSEITVKCISGVVQTLRFGKAPIKGFNYCSGHMHWGLIMWASGRRLYSSLRRGNVEWGTQRTSDYPSVCHFSKTGLDPVKKKGSTGLFLWSSSLRKYISHKGTACTQVALQVMSFSKLLVEVRKVLFMLQLSFLTKRNIFLFEGLFIVCISVHAFCC